MHMELLCDMHESAICSARLRSRLGAETLDCAIRICIEGPEKLNNSELVAIVQNWKHLKKNLTFFNISIDFYKAQCNIGINYFIIIINFNHFYLT